MSPLIVDSFAGGGGASTGILMALGRSPDIAINHNPVALAIHARNHPETLHLSENIYRVDPLDHVAGLRVGLAWFSPDCKHFSKAKGGKPVERNIRDLAWVVVLWAERARPDVIILENVEEFRFWGPLIETDRGLMPDPAARGETFKDWCKALRQRGYRIEWRELRACDYGAPTIRKRFFLIARRDGEKIVWPKPTHGAPDDPDVVRGRKKTWRTAAEIIDWSLPCPSIFDDAAEILQKHGLRAVRPLADATMARVARGVKKYVLEAERPFLVTLTHGARIEDVDAPMRTITGAHRGEKAVISPSVIKFNSGATGSAIGDPLPTVTANSFIKRPGGAAPLGLLAPVLTAAQHGGSVRAADGPVQTTTASRKDQNAVAVAFLAQHNTGVVGHAADEPVSTITATGSNQAVVSALITRQFGASVGHAIDSPLGTVTAEGGGKSGLVAPFFAKYYGTGDGARTDEPCHSVTTRDRFAHLEAGIEAPPLAGAARARAVADFLRAHGAWDDRDLVTLTIGGAVYVLADIGMRMLTPRELFAAQGFPGDYDIDFEHDGRPLPKDAQIAACGNSVCPPLAAALVAANCGHLAMSREAAE